MVGVIAIDAVVGKDIQMCRTSRLGYPFCPSFPISGTRGDIEDGLARLAVAPRLHRRRLLDLQPETVTAFEVPSGIIGATPVPLRLQRQSDDRFSHLPSEDIGDERLTERCL